METNSNFNHPPTLPSVQPPPPSAAARKKRTKLIGVVSGGHVAKRRATKKLGPSAPKITACTECGKRFDSWKALYGHMRCHPERNWRGINPPPHLRRRPEPASSRTEEDSSSITDEDQEVATCLLMLANGPASDQSPSLTTVNQPTPQHSDPDPGLNSGRFECSSCKKVFDSHQALGGHRASHKNVKGCYAITKNDGEDEGFCSGMVIKDNGNGNNTNTNNMRHKCTMCFRVFPKGQALGGHMKCHWEKVDDPGVLGFDLNVVAPLRDDDDASSPAFVSGGMALDLRLGL